jgi:hypothetical protein
MQLTQNKRSDVFLAIIYLSNHDNPCILLCHMASLDSVKCKIFRATQHIESLQTEIQGYFDTKPGKMVRQPHDREDEVVFTFVVDNPIPARFGLIIGDILQNLRSSLDYLVWELVLAANGTPDEKNMFPICSTVEAFKEQIARHRLDGVATDAIAEIEALQPYHLGQDFTKSIIRCIDEFTNINKHRRILLTSLMTRPVAKENFVVQGSQMLVHFEAGPTPTFESNAKFGPFPLIDGKVQVNSQFIVGIAFDEGAAKGMEISGSVNQWAYYIIHSLLPQFERFFL